MTLDILYQDNHLLVVNKPAGMLVQPDATGDASLFDLVGDYRKVHEQKPGKAFVGIVHRLDRPVSGVVAVAKTSKAAARLSQQFRNAIVRKTYWAVVEADVKSIRAMFDAGKSVVWQDRLQKSATSNRVRSVEDDTEQLEGDLSAKAAETVVRLLQSSGKSHLIELQPRTGRSHQLRVQCADRELVILGDRKYGSTRSLGGWIALHARELSVNHPTTGEQFTWRAPTPDSWSRFPFGFERA